MTKQILQNLKGFRDILPAEKRARDFVARKVIETFQRFGFEPLETPTLEYASLLTGKYGEEADKLLYLFKDQGGREIGLRYDQTVPTARVLAQYQNQLPKFFRRYQIQNVFRADKPQKGRYREFTQCDLDIYNSSSTLADSEIVACTYEAFKNVGFKNIRILVNDRQILFKALKDFATKQVNVFSIIQSIDKLDKKPAAAVIEELVQKGLSLENASEALKTIENASINDYLNAIIVACQDLGVPQDCLVFTPNLARGLDYYTAMIFEIVLPDYPISSYAGGGRYDELIGQISSLSVPAVGVAFGFDRMVEAACKLNLIQDEAQGTQVLVTIFNEVYQKYSLQIASQIRQAGINTEIYPEIDKLGKQFKLANQKNIPWVVVIGEEEAKKNQVTLKNMITREQTTLSFDEAIKKIKGL